MPVPKTENYNLATGSKWYMLFPFQKIDPDMTTAGFALNLYNFSIPEFKIGSTNFDIGGVSIPIPTNVRQEVKSLTFNYLLSSNWYQYLFLNKWKRLIANECGGQTALNMQDYMMDIYVIILSEYKNPLFRIVFHNSWLSSLAALDLNYQEDDANISHSFELQFSHYTFQTQTADSCWC